MAVSSRVKLNIPVIRGLDRARIKALEQTAEALHTEVVKSEIMPRDTGALQNEKTSVDTSSSALGHVGIITEGPYARRLYYHPEYDFQTYENAFASGEWYEPWLDGGISEDFAVKAYARILKRIIKKGG